MYKTLPHNFQLIATSSTSIQEVVSNFIYEPVFNFINLEEIENLPLNSIVGKIFLQILFLEKDMRKLINP
jgi:hypothetical protein